MTSSDQSSFNQLLATEQLSYLIRQAPAAFVATLAVLIYTISEIYTLVDPVGLRIWVSAVGLLNLYLLVWYFLAKHHSEPERAQLFIGFYYPQSFLHGLSWGSLPFLMLTSSDYGMQYFSFIILSGMAAGAIGTIAVVYNIYMIFLLSAMLPMLLGQIIFGDSLHLFGGNAIPLLLIYITSLSVLARSYYLSVRKSTILVIENRQLLETTNDALNHAESASKAKSRFLANMSHELRTPLNAVIGYSELIYENAHDQLFDSIEKDALSIKQAGTHLLSLINTVLDVSKIESGKMDIYIEEIDIATFLQELVNTTEPLVTANHNQLKTEFSDNLGVIQGDLTKLNQILFNIIGNAAKFTHEGEIRIQAHGDANHVVFAIHDNGIGMSATELQKLTEPFVQADSSTTRKYGGTGLGMHLCQHLCNILDIDLQVKSEPNNGSSFILTLPREYQSSTTQL